MVYRVFILSMPNRASWNGKWTGDKRLFCIVKKYNEGDPVLVHVDKAGSHYYNFEDGWGALVEIKKVDRSDAVKFRRHSEGFQGYGWMIDEIEKHGRILARSERKERKSDN